MLINGRTNINYTTTLLINKVKVYVSIKYGKITVKGRVLSNVIADKINGKWVYYNPINGEKIIKYHHKKPKQLIEAIEKERLEIN